MTYDKLNPEVRSLMSKMWADIQRSSNEAEKRRAEADPVKHKLSRVIEGGTGYSYYDAGKNGRGSRVRYCYATNRNVAGYFLLWRETLMAKKVTRDLWDATTSKKAAIRWARELAKKPQAWGEVG